MITKEQFRDVCSIVRDLRRHGKQVHVFQFTNIVSRVDITIDTIYYVNVMDHTQQETALTIHDFYSYMYALKSFYYTIEMNLLDHTWQQTNEKIKR